MEKMSNTALESLLKNQPVIAAVRSPKSLREAIDSPCSVIFLLCGSVYNLKSMVTHVARAGKSCFVHLDLLKGYGQDSYFVRYLADEIKPTGVISTKNTLLQRAKQDGLMTVRRAFLLDSSALDVSIAAANKVKPDAVEILPGVSPKLIRLASESMNLPIITGGFISTEEEVMQGIEAGACACSTSVPSLWMLDGAKKN